MSQLLQFYKSFQQARAPVAKAAPTFEDLIIDDKLTEHQRVVRYSKSSIGLQRLVHVKMLADVAAAVGFDETVTSLVPLIDDLSRDNETVVKQHLVEQLKTLAKFCVAAGGERGYKVVINKILPITASLLEDEKPEVRHSASNTLVSIAPLLSGDDIGQYILTIVLRLAHEDDKEEMRMTACQLLNMLAETLGADLCKQFVIPEVVSLAEDPVFRVRKATALNFHSICKVGGEHELLERLMPAFVRLSKDDMYRVRKACADGLTDISKNVSDDVRLGVLVEIFLRLTQDPSRMVKQSILQQSGTFIATLPSPYVSSTILSHYCSMIYSPTGDLPTDAELKQLCAFCFPAVLQVIGRNRWKDVREVYHQLAQTHSTPIRQTMAHSLHEIALILADSHLVEEELLTVFESMLQDLEPIQMGVIKHMAAFLSTLPPLCRVSYLPLLHDILHSTNPFNWRLRQSLAVQLPSLILLPPKQDLYQTLFPLILILLQDPVASVRVNSFPGVSALILNLYDLSRGMSTGDSASNCSNGTTQSVDDGDASSVMSMSKHYLENVARSINSFAVGAKYQLRQLWIELCHRLLYDLPKELFERYFISKILQLTCDRVTNVRVTMACFLAGWETGGGAIHSYVTAAGPRRPSPSEDPINSNSSGKHASTAGGAGTGGGEISTPATPMNSRTSSVDVYGGSVTTTGVNVENGDSMKKNLEVEKVAAGLLRASATTSSDETGLMSGEDADGVNLGAIPGIEKTPYAWLLGRKDIQMCVDRLSVDDIDVYLNMVKLQPAFPRFNFKSISCRGMRVAPGGNTPIPMNPAAVPLWSSTDEVLSGSVHSETGFFSSSSSVSDDLGNSQLSDNGGTSTLLAAAAATVAASTSAPVAASRARTSSGGAGMVDTEKRRLRSPSTEASLPLPTAVPVGAIPSAPLGLYMPPPPPLSVSSNDDDLSPPPARPPSNEGGASFLEMQLEMDKIDGIFPQSMGSPAGNIGSGGAGCGSTLMSPSHGGLQHAPQAPDAQQSALETLLSEDMDISHVDISAIDISAAKEIMVRHRPAVSMLQFEDDDVAQQPPQLDSLTDAPSELDAVISTPNPPTNLPENGTNTAIAVPVNVENAPATGEVAKTLSEFVDSVDLS